MSYVLYRIDVCRWTWRTPNPPNHPNFCIFVTFHIFVVSKYREFIFGIQVDRSQSQPMDNKPSLKGVWLRHVTRFSFFGAPSISQEWLKLELSHFVYRRLYQVLPKGWQINADQLLTCDMLNAPWLLTDNSNGLVGVFELFGPHNVMGHKTFNFLFFILPKSNYLNMHKNSLKFLRL